MKLKEMDFPMKRKRAHAISKSCVATTCLLFLAGETSASHVVNNRISSFTPRIRKFIRNEDELAFISFGRSSRRLPNARGRVRLYYNEKKINGDNVNGDKINGESILSSTEKYLSNISDRQQLALPVVNGDVNGDSSNLGVNGSLGKNMHISVAEDDDYAMSIPKPPQLNNEELSSTRNQVIRSEEDLINSKLAGNATSVILSQNASGVGDQQTFITNLINNFSTKATDDSDEMESSAEESLSRWSEWMTTGKKLRPTSSKTKAKQDAAAAANEKSSSTDKMESIEAMSVSEQSTEKTKSPQESLSRWSEWMTTGKKLGPTSSKTKAKQDAPAAANENAPSTDKMEYIEAMSVSEEATEKTKSPPNKMLIKIKGELSKKKSEMEQQQQQRKQERAEKRQIERKQKQREEKQYREQRDADPGRISASDWSHNILNIIHSRILKDIRSPVIFSCIWATFWSVVYKSLISAGQSPHKNADLALRIASSMTIPTTAHSVMVSAMSLLLVFRTNSAYQRFAEGRKIWEDVVSTSRDFSRMVKLYEFAVGTPKCRRIMQLLASFPYLLRHRIRPSLLQMKKVNDPNLIRDPENSLLLYPDVSMKDTDPEIAALAYDEEETGSSRRKTRELCWVDKRTLPWKLLPGTALDLCARAQNRPLWVVDRMAKELCVVPDVQPTFTNRERMALMAYTDKLSRSIGACERIHQTVVPLNYARHALRSVTVWLWTLPFAFIKDLGLLTGPIIAIIAWILFGVYEIGTRIEDPFQGTLRLSIYCDAIRRDVLADAIVRDTAFELDGEIQDKGETDGDEDAIFEFESDSDEYGEADGGSTKRKKAKIKKEKSWFQNQKMD